MILPTDTNPTNQIQKGDFYIHTLSPHIRFRQMVFTMHPTHQTQRNDPYDACHHHTSGLYLRRVIAALHAWRHNTEAGVGTKLLRWGARHHGPGRYWWWRQGSWRPSVHGLPTWHHAWWAAWWDAMLVAIGCRGRWVVNVHHTPCKPVTVCDRR